MSSSSGSKGKSNPEEKLLGSEVHGLKLEDIEPKEINGLVKSVWLDNDYYLAILYNAELYIERYPEILHDALPILHGFPQEDSELARQGRLMLCRKTVPDPICWELVEGEIGIEFVKPRHHPGDKEAFAERSRVVLMKMQASYTARLAKREMTLLCYSDYKLVHYLLNRDEDAKERIRLSHQLAELGQDVQEYADAVGKLRAKGSGSKASE